MLVAILMLNTLGYYGIFLGLQYRNDLAMANALDDEMYDSANSIMFTVAVSLPYIPDQTDFERVSGKFEYEGELYRMVKQRYAKDVLTVVCIRDTEHKKINHALADYVKTFTGKAAHDKPTSKISVTIIKDYLPMFISIDPVANGWATRISRNTDHRVLMSTFTSSIVHPPERA